MIAEPIRYTIETKSRTHPSQRDNNPLPIVEATFVCPECTLKVTPDIDATKNVPRKDGTYMLLVDGKDVVHGIKHSGRINIDHHSMRFCAASLSPIGFEFDGPCRFEWKGFGESSTPSDTEFSMTLYRVPILTSAAAPAGLDFGGVFSSADSVSLKYGSNDLRSQLGDAFAGVLHPKPAGKGPAISSSASGDNGTPVAQMKWSWPLGAPIDSSGSGSLALDGRALEQHEVRAVMITAHRAIADAQRNDQNTY
ncbi:hypothetical protein C8R47DRAFT_1212076 [Mycena vitilis]|nr:hypothetical protein C8R47DRAFT_1212076 [Mycena vitilis]